MANPICLSPLKFYDNISKQNRYRSFAYGHVAPLITNPNVVTPFCINLGTQNAGKAHSISEVWLYNANTNSRIGNYTEKFIDAGLHIEEINGCVMIWFLGLFPLTGTIDYEGQYFIEIKEVSHEPIFSEVFCFSINVDDCLKIEYWNPEGNFYIGGKYPIFPSERAFHNIVLLKSELGKPEYSFEEEATKRLGYSFIESQVSKKTYKFNTVIPEYLCDALRIIRLCSKKQITSRGETYNAMSFDIEVEWQEQGDLASATCEFDVDNIITNLGGFKYEALGGDYNSDYNDDFNNENSGGPN